MIVHPNKEIPPNAMINERMTTIRQNKFSLCEIYVPNFRLNSPIGYLLIHNIKEQIRTTNKGPSSIILYKVEFVD